MPQTNNIRHWPEFENVLCGDMTDRERLGLPNYYVADRIANRIQTLFQALRALSAPELLARIEAAETELAEKIVAGNLLALIGDPRIQTLNPEKTTMIISIAIMTT